MRGIDSREITFLMPDAKAHNPFLAQRNSGEPARFRRSMRIDSIDEEKRTIDISFSSDVDLERWPGYFEKLDHSSGACDLTRLNNSASCLWNHDWDELCGVIERAWIDGGKGRCTVRFGNSDRAKQVWPDVKDKIIRNVSVGYEVMAEELSLNDETGCHYTVTRWAPYEVSFVTVPADISVGAGRLNLRNASLSATDNTRKTMPPAIEAAPAAPSTAPAAPAVVVTETRSDQFKDAKRIIDIGARFNAKEEAAQAIADGITVSEFQERLLERTKKAVASRTDTPLGLSPKEIKRFSIARAIAWQIAAKEGLSEEKRLAEEASYEREVILAANDIRTKQGRAPKGMYIPSEVLHQGRVQLTDEQARELDAKTRAVVSVSSSIGDSNVGATQQPLLDTASFAELLRPECLLMNFCTVVQGLTGEYQIPKHVSGAVGGWVSEDGTAPGTDAIFTQLKSDPHTAGGVAEITRRAILTSALDMESIIRTDLARGVGQTIDLAGYYGTGANGQPTGLTLTDGIKIVQFAGALSGTDHLSPEFTEAVAMETVIGQGNFKISPANGAYLFNAYGRGWAKTRQKFPGTPTGMTLWEPGETVNGYKTGISNQIQNGHWFFGDWKQLFMCLWSGLDLLVDPFTRSDKGRVRIVALQDIDYLNRRPEAFSFGYHY